MSMPRKGIASLFSSSRTLSPSYTFPTPRISPRHTFSESMMLENIDNAEPLITKWDLDLNSASYTTVTTLFQHDRGEAMQFIKSVQGLRRSMHFLISTNSSPEKLVLAQKLMQIAMKRLETEFYLILSTNRDRLDPDSISCRYSGVSSNSEDETEEEYPQGNVKKDRRLTADAEPMLELAMSDLKSIADCMISSGYGRECVNIYKLIRKSIVDEGLYKLGIEQFKSAAIQKLSWTALEPMIKKWLIAVKVAVRTLFRGERILSDHVFSASSSIRESCFTSVVKDGAMNLFRFPEVVSGTKGSTEKIYRLMEVYEITFDLWPDIEQIFSYESTSDVNVQVLSSLVRLGETIRHIIANFESTIQKDSARTLVPGGKVHPLTEMVMAFTSSLMDYSGILSEILSDHPLPDNLPLPELYVEHPGSDVGPTLAVAVFLARLILILLCKLDTISTLYKDVSLSYLFLANNLNYIVQTVKTTNLKYFLGQGWVTRHNKKAEQFVSSYEALAWNKVLCSLPENNRARSVEEVTESFSKFNAAFEEAYQKQTLWVIPDRKLRDDIKVSIAKKLVPAYREFCNTSMGLLSGDTDLGVLVRFGPDDLENYLSDLFHGTSWSSSSFSSSYSEVPSPR